MARYFPSNSRMAVGVTDYLDPPNYDRLAFEIDKQDALTSAAMNQQGAEQIEAQQDAERYIAMAKDGASSMDANSQTRMYGEIGGGIINGISGGLGFMDFGGNSGGGIPAVPRESPGMGIPGSVAPDGQPMYGPAW